MIDTNQLLEWLMTWYHSNCDGDWEHQNGIEIGTLDNPGWYIKVNLQDTSKDACTVPRKLVERTETNWIDIETKEDKFCAYGGPENLAEIINLFVMFVEDRLNLES